MQHLRGEEFHSDVEINVQKTESLQCFSVKCGY